MRLALVAEAIAAWLVAGGWMLRRSAFGFPDGHRTELEHALSELLPPAAAGLAVVGLIACWWLRHPTVGRVVVVACLGMATVAAVMGLEWVWTARLDHGQGG